MPISEQCVFGPIVDGHAACEKCGRRVPVRVAGKIRAACQAIDLGAPRGKSRPRNSCRHLGSHVGFVDCPSCAGHVALKVFRCGHPAHGEVTYQDCERCADFEAPGALANVRTLLLRFWHGLGDHVQLTVVLRHLRYYFPSWSIDLACHRSKATGFMEAGLCRSIYELGDEPPAADYDAVRDLHWHEPEECFGDSPATKAELCLRRVFQLQPRSELCGYEIAITESAAARVKRAPERFVLLHYQGNTARDAKNIPEFNMRPAVREAVARGYDVVLLDFDRRSGLRDERGVVCFEAGDAMWGEHAHGDAASIAALAARASLCIGIDSGPGKIMAAVAPTLILWWALHPIHYHGIDGAVHVLRPNHELAIRGDRPAGASYFYTQYAHVVLRHGYDELPAIVGAALGDWPGFRARSRSLCGAWWRAGDLPIVREQSADEYHLSELAGTIPRPDVVLDLGAHIGLFARRAVATWPGVRVVCVEPAAENLRYLEHNTLTLGPEPVTIEHAAVVPERGDWVLLNSCGGNAGSSDSVIVARSVAADRMREMPGRWTLDGTLRRFLTIEELMRTDDARRVLVKIDVEGSEWELLPAIGWWRHRIAAVVGEYHGGRSIGAWARLESVAARSFPKSTLCELSHKRPDFDDGSFCLTPNA